MSTVRNPVETATVGNHDRSRPQPASARHPRTMDRDHGLDPPVPDAADGRIEDETWRRAPRGIAISVAIAIPIWVGLILLLIRFL